MKPWLRLVHVRHTRRLCAGGFLALVLMILLLGCMPRLISAEVLDRVVAVVNRRPILASEWDDAIRYECFLNQCSLKQLTAADRQATLERMIDQQLIEQQMRIEDPHSVGADVVARKLAELKSQILRQRNPASPQSSTEWNLALAQYGFTQQEIEDHVARELNVLRFVDRRFRPTIQIDAAQIERYYNQTFIPELHQAGAPGQPPAEVAAQIRELLTQKALDEQINLWLETLRREGGIQMK